MTTSLYDTRNPRPLPYDHPHRTARRQSMATSAVGARTAVIEELLTGLLAEPLNEDMIVRAFVADEIDALAEVLQDRADRSIDLP